MKKKKLLKFISSIAMALMIIFSNTLNIFANDIYNNLESSIIKETEDIDLEEEKIVKIELDNKARNILGIEYIKVKISASYDSKNKMHVWNFNVDIPTSIFVKPPLKLKVQILRSNTENGTYSNYGILKDFGNVNTIKNYKHSVPAKTGYYKVKLISQLKPDGSNSYLPAKTVNTYYGLLNRTGKLWNASYTDKKSGKTLGKPRAYYVKNTIHKRPSNLNTTYYNEYKRRYGVTLNSSLYDVHHIKPLAYGVDNSFSNLIHLPKSIHKTVTSWFSGY